MKKVFKTGFNLFTAMLIVMATILLFFVPTVVAAASNIPDATSEFYVNDFAQVFSANEKEDLMNRAVGLSRESDGIQVVVVTIKSLDGNTIENYANEMYNHYKIGKDDMGLLILLSTEDREIRVEVGKSMEMYINDSKAGRLIDKYAIPKLKENNFSQGLIVLQTELINEIKNATSKSDADTSTTPTPVNWQLIGIIVVLLVILGACIGIIFVILKKSQEIAILEQEKENLNFEIDEVKKVALFKIDNLKNETINIQKQNNSIKRQLEGYRNKFKVLENRYAKALIIQPLLDEKIDAMIEEEARKNDIKKAQLVENMINKALNIPIERSSFEIYNRVVEEYNNLDGRQRNLVVEDINEVHRRLKASEELSFKYLAGVATKKIISIISNIDEAKERDIKDIERAKAMYNNLDTNIKGYIDSKIPETISLLLLQAKSDKEKIEEENRIRHEELRRRQADEDTDEDSDDDSDNNNNHFGGGFSGFGGISGGGGASRGF